LMDAAALFVAYERQVFQFFLNRTGDYMRAGDLHGEWALRLTLADRNGRLPENVEGSKSWAFAVARNVAISEWRKWQRQVATQPLEEVSEHWGAHVDLAEMANASAEVDKVRQVYHQCMTPRQQEVFYGLFVEERGLLEYAAASGTSHQIVLKIRRRALDAIGLELGC